MNDYQNKPTALVTGCTKGIGLAVCRKFAKEGFNIAGCARSQNDLTSLFTELSTEYPKQQFFMEVCDVANKEQLASFAQDVLTEFGSVDVLINNAGLFLAGEIITEPENQFETLFQTNVASAYHLSRAISKSMIEKRKGHIFNLCSIASIKAYPNGGSYTITKHALLGLNNALREELLPFGIRVTALLPGATLTESWNGTTLPDDRFMPAEDIATLIFCASELSSRTNVEQILVRPTAGDI